ncbi:hypothetical protein Y032_0081g1449 [Ancylostoma ceylanicum]|uniref:Uncharacterized protein n=1 Tax=Ancylostoma ceylanicum TaxID=53326 RepID=A0A016TSI4_9BILA|nr:hypothetical protein Y032_0081g1449 [Ancylostoma ceylanicum]
MEETFKKYGRKDNSYEKILLFVWGGKIATAWDHVLDRSSAGPTYVEARVSRTCQGRNSNKAPIPKK